MTIRRNVLAAVTSIPLATCVALATTSGNAQAAAIDRPTAIMAFVSSSVKADISAKVTFATTGAPNGSVIYLERTSGTGHPWVPVAQVRAANGTVRVPADPVGHFKYRIVVASDGRTLAVSAPESLTVTAPTGDCSVCKFVKDAYHLAQQVVPGILAIIITDFFGI